MRPILFAVVFLAACSSERIVLLPSSDGRPSAVVVRDARGEILVDRPYTGTIRRGGGNAPYAPSPEEVKARYAATLAAMPPKPVSYILYFLEGSDRLTAESEAAFAAVRAEIAARATSEAMVIGHTDRVGSVQSNEALSRKRAEAARNLLIEAGIQPNKLELVGRGEREPLVPTEDEVPEPRNRRVEINLR